MAGPEFEQTMRRALKDEFLGKALKTATGVFKNNRALSFGQLGYIEDLRKRARAAKDRALSNLYEYLVQLEGKVTEAGGRVVWAKDGQAVIDYIVNLSREKGLKLAVKGKSMTTEEIELNPALIEAGMEVWETDLGEYIIQLCGERPSHIVGPAIHKTKEQIARLFEEHINLPYTEVPEVMTLAVREELRQRFFSADLGITGVNMAVAETGTLILFENEGNIRMSTTLPKIHVAVMGLEKVVADMEDASVLMQALPLAATGQRCSSYVSFLTGAGRQDGAGPEELHLIILDGFRSRVLGDPDLWSILRCLRCGACLNYCPVYRRLGGHSYPWVYSGPIGVVLTAAALGPEASREIVGASTLCMSCRDVCPVMIDLPELILKLRERHASGDPWLKTAVQAAARGLASPRGFDLAGRVMDAGGRMTVDASGRVKRGPAALRNLGEGRRLPRLAPETFHRSLLKGDEE